MIDPPQSNQLNLDVEKDVADGFRSLGRHDDAEALIRSGGITIKGTETREGKKCFEIELFSGVFQEPEKPIRPMRSGLIPYDSDALFQIVQECRELWHAAVIDCSYTVDLPQGGQKSHYPFERSWQNPVDPEKFNEIAARLAAAGNRLFTLLFERNSGTPLDDVAIKLRHAAQSGECVFTVNSHDFHIPWGMLYTHPNPDVPLVPDGSNYDPRGFWGYQHIIEQFTNKHDLKNWLGPIVGKLQFGAALDEEIDDKFSVPCISRHRDFIGAIEERVQYAEWTKRAELGAALSTYPFEQQIVYFLCHAEGAGTLAQPHLSPPAIVINGAKIYATDIKAWVERRFETNQPLVFINACCGGQLNTLVYRSFTFATEFLDRGAACVVGPQIEVPAVFAGEYGGRFFELFLSSAIPSPKVGPLIQRLNREFWKKQNPLGLVYSLYASADCSIRWDENPG